MNLLEIIQKDKLTAIAVGGALGMLISATPISIGIHFKNKYETPSVKKEETMRTQLNILQSDLYSSICSMSNRTEIPKISSAANQIISKREDYEEFISNPRVSKEVKKYNKYMCGPMLGLLMIPGFSFMISTMFFALGSIYKLDEYLTKKFKKTNSSSTNPN